MSDFFRIKIPAEIAVAGPCTLARLMHEAEDGEDDVLLMQVAAVMESRSLTEQGIYRESYMLQWTKRMEAK